MLRRLLECVLETGAQKLQDLDQIIGIEVSRGCMLDQVHQPLQSLDVQKQRILDSIDKHGEERSKVTLLEHGSEAYDFSYGLLSFNSSQASARIKSDAKVPSLSFSP